MKCCDWVTMSWSVAGGNGRVTDQFSSTTARSFGTACIRYLIKIKGTYPIRSKNKSPVLALLGGNPFKGGPSAEAIPCIASDESCCSTLLTAALKTERLNKQFVEVSRP